MSYSTISTKNEDISNLLNDFINLDSDINIENDIDINQNKDICEYCESNNLITEHHGGVVICQDCGHVLDQVIDVGAEWRFYGVDDSKSSDPTRCGLPGNSLLPESSLGSIVGMSNNYDMKKIRKYHTWNAMPYKERSLYNVFDQLTIRAINSGISPCIIEEAKRMYKTLSENKISRGANRKGLIASCIYIACKKKNVPRSAKEVAEIFKLDITNMTKGCKKFVEIMNSIHTEDDIELSASNPDHFIHRFCSKLNIQGKMLDMCRFVAKKSENYNLVSENTPPSIAAGSIYLIASEFNINLSKKDIAEACKISEVTISKCYKKLYKYRKYILPKLKK